MGMMALKENELPFQAPRGFSQGFRQRAFMLFRHEKESHFPWSRRLRVMRVQD